MLNGPTSPNISQGPQKIGHSGNCRLGQLEMGIHCRLSELHENAITMCPRAKYLDYNASLEFLIKIKF
jgi:hypothetical protein